MLNINGLRNYYFMPDLYDMRCGAQRVLETIRVKTGHDPYKGDVFIYMSKWKNRGGVTPEWDYSLEPVIGVFFCNFHVGELEPRIIVRSRIMDEDSLKPIGGISRYIYIQMPFFNKSEHECESLIDQWIYNLKNMGPNQEVAFKSRNEIFRRLEKISNVATLTPEERYSYEADVKNARDTLNQIRFAYDDGLAKGRAETLAESIRRAREMGLSEDVIAKLFGSN